MKGLYETGGSVSGFSLDYSHLALPERPVRVKITTELVLDADPGSPDAYAHPSTNWSPANPNRDAVSDANFGADYAGRGIFRDWGSTSRNPCLGRQWAADLGGYRQARRGPHKFTWLGLPTFVRQEV